MKLKKFLKEIEKEMIELVEKLDDKNEGKCHTIANLVSSYLHVHFDKEFKHVKLIRHGWSASEEFIIDFVQQTHPRIIKQGTKDFKLMKLNEQDPSSEHYYLLALDRALLVKDPHKPKSFIKYIKNNYKAIDKRVVACGYYR